MSCRRSRRRRCCFVVHEKVLQDLYKVFGHMELRVVEIDKSIILVDDFINDGFLVTGTCDNVLVI